MCGRFFRHRSYDEVTGIRELIIRDLALPAGSYNVAPGSPILAVRYDARSRERVLGSLHWGLIPSFAKDRKIAWKLINARAESIDRQASFRAAFAKRRCLIPVDGFYEWSKDKQPYAYALRTREPMMLAGLWENWRDPESDEWLRSCTIITTEPNALIAEVHDRMPVILQPEDYGRWLEDERQEGAGLKDLLRPFPAEGMVSWPVSRALNKPGAADDPTLLEPVPAP